MSKSLALVVCIPLDHAYIYKLTIPLDEGIDAIKKALRKAEDKSTAETQVKVRLVGGVVPVQGRVGAEQGM